MSYTATLDAIDREVYYRPLAPPVQPRDIVTFARSCRNPPGGPFPLMFYDDRIHPGQREFLRAVNEWKYTYFVVKACVQDGKSWVAIQIPLMYFAIEMKEPVLYAIPDMRTAEDAWSEKIQPGMEHTPELAGHLPRRGAGSAGGSKINTVRLHDAASIFFVGKGGTNKSSSASRTTRIVLQDEFGKIQKELAPKYDRRADSFDTRAIRIKAGTVELAQGDLLIAAFNNGTQHTPHYQCHWCGEYTRLLWDNVTYNNRSDRAARESATIACEHCGEEWTDAERKDNLLTGVAVPAAQTIDRFGVIHGDEPETEIYSLTWCAMDSPLKSLGTLAVMHRQAVHDDETGNAHPLREFWHDQLALPFPEVDMSESVMATSIAQRSSLSDYSVGEVPSGAVFLVAIIDQQLRRYFWEVMAFDNEGRSWVVDYGQQSICGEGETPDKLQRMSVLRALIEKLRLGRANPTTGEVLRPLRIGIDLGGGDGKVSWLSDTVDEFHTEHDVVFIRGAGDFQVKGMGRSGKGIEGQRMDGWYDYRKVDRDTTPYHILWIESDTVKHEVYRSLQRDIGSTGAMHIPCGLSAEDDFPRHLTSEEWKQKKSGALAWQRRPGGGRNDWFDTTYYGLAMARYLREHFGWLIRPATQISDTDIRRDDEDGLDLSWR